MKHIYKILAVLVLLAAVTNANAQRYLEEVFDNVTVTTDVVYGNNATVLYYPITLEAIPEDLVMDVYEPEGDTETARPLVLIFHTGNFIPHPDNGGTGGLRTDSSVVEIATRLAKMGYVAASCDYRLGWNPVAETQEERTKTLIQAAYRGVQDARTCTRYFRKSVAEDDNPFGVDTDKIAIWGDGTGGYISLASATLDDYAETLIPKFIGEDDEGNPLPMIIELVHGDIYGTSVGINPFDGDTLCYPNHVGYDSDFDVCLNMGGAIGDISWLEEGEMPIISYHVPTDPFAPYEEGIVIVPVLDLPVVEVQGSYLVQQQQDFFGNNDVFANSGISDVWTDGANVNNDGYEGLSPFVRPAEMPADSGPWQWWDTETNPNSDNGLLTNPDMSPEKANAFIDSIIGYAAPRLSCALFLPENPCEVDAPANDDCNTAIDVNSSLGGPANEPQESGPYTNVGATSDGDFDIGFDCFADADSEGNSPSLDQTVWFTFTGDGLEYFIDVTDCGGDATFFENDTQMAIYEGDCVSGLPVACNDDFDFDNGDLSAATTLQTEEGVTYIMMIDGFNYWAYGEQPPAEGDFCIEFTHIVVSVEENNLVDLNIYPNPGNELITLTTSVKADRILMFNAVGELVRDIQPQTSQEQVDVSDLSKGVYSFVVKSGDFTTAQKFVKY